MPYIDLEYKLRTDDAFYNEIAQYAENLRTAGEAAATNPSVEWRYKELLNDFLLACDNNPVMLTPYFFPKYPKGDPLNFLDYPFAWNLFRWEVGAVTTVRGSRQIAKCRPVNALEPVYGVQGQLLYPADLTVGQSILCLDQNNQRACDVIVAKHSTGKQMVYSVELRSGQQFMFSGNHLLRTLNSWTPVEALKPGHKIAELNLGGFFGTTPVATARIVLTAYMIGDGCMGCSGNQTFTSACDASLDEFSKLSQPLQRLPLRRHQKQNNKASSIAMSRLSQACTWWKEDGLWKHKSWEKFIPDWVFQMPFDETRLFLSRLWATDGTITQTSKAYTDISYTSTSRRLAAGVKSLLLKFGILTTTITGIGKCYGKAGHRYYKVRVKTRASIEKFCNLFYDIPGKSVNGIKMTDARSNNNDDVLPNEIFSVLDSMRKACQFIPGAAFKPNGLTLHRCYNPGHEKLDRYLQHGRQYVPDHESVAQLDYWLNKTHLTWSNVKSIKPVGVEDTWDIETETHHNYILDGLVAHNSTALAAFQILSARLIPNFTTSYLCPRNDQLETYANRLRDIERAQYDFSGRDSDFRSNLRLKEFSNHSKIELMYAHTSATNIRGKSTDALNLDECDSPLSLLWNGEKFDILVDLKPGDRIVGFDEHNQLKYDRVKRTICKGRRHTWRINFANGSFLECTGNARLNTNFGWLYLSQILLHSENLRCSRAVAVEALVRERRTAAARYATWRWISRLHYPQACALPHTPRSSAERLLHAQSGIIESLCQHPSTDRTELRVGQGELCLLDGDYSQVRLYTLPVLPPNIQDAQWKTRVHETCSPDMAGSIDLGGDRLLVHGRRKFGSRLGEHLDSQLQHARVPGGSGEITSQNAERQGRGSEGPSCSEEGQSVLDDSSDSRLNTRLSEAYIALRASLDAVQIPVVSEHHALPVLRRTDRECEDCHGHRITPVLRQTGLQECEASGGLCRVDREARPTEEEQRKADRVPEQQFGTLPGANESCTHKTRSGPGVQSQMGKTPHGVEIGVVQDSRRQGQESRLRRPLSREEESPLGSLEGVELELTAITSIEYLGEQEVWDVETEKHHTFFANGVAVHNCQDFDPDLEIEVEMMQSASKTPMTMYTGTSLTTDTFLEKKFTESSQASWIIKCPGCNHDNIPLPEFNVMDMIQPQGPSCSKCGKLLDVTTGHFVHADLQSFAASRYGYHIPQLIVPAVVNNPVRWERIYRQKHKGNPGKFLQEILGIPVEEGSRELTKQQLQDMCILGKDLQALKQKAASGKYQWVVSGCDWGGSDYQPMTKSKISTTVHVICGITPDGYIDILHFNRLTGMDYDTIAGTIIAEFKAYGGFAIASDTGVGQAYNDKLRYKIPQERHLMFTYSGPDTQLIAEPKRIHLFNTWMLNKTDSLTFTFEAIRNKRIRCFSWEYAEEYLMDCLNMYRAPGEKAGGAGTNTFVYRASASKPNDALQAINYAHMLARIVMGEPMFADQSMKNRIEMILRGQQMYIDPGDNGAFSG